MISPLKVVFSTLVLDKFYHNDHIGGLVPYVKNGATVIADDYTVEAIKSFPIFKETINPDILPQLNIVRTNQKKKHRKKLKNSLRKML